MPASEQEEEILSSHYSSLCSEPITDTDLNENKLYIPVTLLGPIISALVCWNWLHCHASCLLHVNSNCCTNTACFHNSETHNGWQWSLDNDSPVTLKTHLLMWKICDASLNLLRFAKIYYITEMHQPLESWLYVNSGCLCIKDVISLPTSPVIVIQC